MKRRFRIFELDKDRGIYQLTIPLARHEQERFDDCDTMEEAREKIQEDQYSDSFDEYVALEILTKKEKGG